MAMMIDLTDNERLTTANECLDRANAGIQLLEIVLANAPEAVRKSLRLVLVDLNVASEALYNLELDAGRPWHLDHAFAAE